MPLSFRSIELFRDVAIQRANPEQLEFNRVSDKRQLVAFVERGGHATCVAGLVKRNFSGGGISEWSETATFEGVAQR